MTATRSVSSGGGRRSDSTIVGSCPAIRAAVELARRAAPTDMPVLIIGETGTGKELLAHLVHHGGARTGRLVAVDCGALPDELVESLLFGHRRGAFTGAVEHSPGLMAEAEAGTLFMDELGSLSLRGQSKLLRALETGDIRRVGESKVRRVNFRLVATAQRGLSEMVEQGRFRGDLVQRLAGVVIQLPRLRDRGEDVALLAHHFADREGLSLEPDALSLLTRREWPGNVRELRWTMARCALFADDGVVSSHTVGAALEIGPAQLEAGARANGRHREIELRAVCEAHRGDAAEVARALGIGRSTLYRRLNRAGLRLRTFRARAHSA